MAKEQPNQLNESKPISRRSPPVVVEYDCYQGRREKLFQQAYQAKSFYVLKDKQGKNPTIRKGS